METCELRNWWRSSPKGRFWRIASPPKLAIIEEGEFNGKVEMKKIEMKKEESKVIELELKGREVGKP